MNKKQFKNIKIGDKVVIDDDSRFKGQVVTVIKTYNEVPNNTNITVRSHIVGARKYSYKDLQKYEGS